ncbi:hypothetical protein P4S73_28915 [Paraglaciecola sp. Hal342]
MSFSLRAPHDDAEEFEDINGSFCVCDIGGNTTDISVLVPGDEITINHKLSGSRHIGVLNIKDTLKVFAAKFQVTNIPPVEVNSVNYVACFTL